MPINPMLQELNQANRTNNNNILSLLQNSNNPQELVNNILASNPQITDLINKYGNGDPKTAFYEYARQSGQNPQAILDMVKKFI
jgi:hypothetical protein